MRKPKRKFGRKSVCSLDASELERPCTRSPTTRRQSAPPPIQGLSTPSTLTPPNQGAPLAASRSTSTRRFRPRPRQSPRPPSAPTRSTWLTSRVWITTSRWDHPSPTPTVRATGPPSQTPDPGRQGQRHLPRQQERGWRTSTSTCTRACAARCASVTVRRRCTCSSWWWQGSSTSELAASRDSTSERCVSTSSLYFCTWFCALFAGADPGFVQGGHIPLGSWPILKLRIMSGNPHPKPPDFFWRNLWWGPTLIQFLENLCPKRTGAAWSWPSPKKGRTDSGIKGRNLTAWILPCIELPQCEKTFVTFSLMFLGPDPVYREMQVLFQHKTDWSCDAFGIRTGCWMWLVRKNLEWLLSPAILMSGVFIDHTASFSFPFVTIRVQVLTSSRLASLERDWVSEPLSSTRRPSFWPHGARCNRTRQQPGPDNNHTIWSFSGPEISEPDNNHPGLDNDQSLCGPKILGPYNDVRKIVRSLSGPETPGQPASRRVRKWRHVPDRWTYRRDSARRFDPSAVLRCTLT